MKSMTKNILFSALVIFGAVSCVKDPFDESLGERISITLTAENPGFGDTKTKSAADSSAVEGRIVYEDSSLFICAPQSMEPSTKTGMNTDGTPFWATGDKISFVTNTTDGYQNNEFTSDQKDSLVKATTFSGSVLPSGYTEAYAFYPYNKDAVITSIDKDVSVTLTIPSNQTPKYASSFDGKADILVSQKLLAPSAKDFDDSQLEFTRKVGFLRIKLYNDNGKETPEALTDNIKSLTIKSSVPFVGDATLNLVSKNLELDTKTNPKYEIKVDYSKIGEGSPDVFAAVCPNSTNEKINFIVYGETTAGNYFYKEAKNIDRPVVSSNKYTFIGVKVKPYKVGDISTTNAWENFVQSQYAMAQVTTEAERNEILKKRILLDYSYAGYMHGTAVPPSPAKEGTNVYNVKTIKDSLQKVYPDVTDRQAFMRALHNAGIYSYNLEAVQSNRKVGKPIKDADGKGAVIFFPTGTYVLHDSTDDNLKGGFNKMPKSNPIVILASNFVIAGEGPGNTVLHMASQNYPTSGEFFSAKEMILIKNPDTDVEDKTGFIPGSPLATVQENVVRGAMSVVVDKKLSFSKGDWVILALDSKITDPSNSDLLKYEFGGHAYNNSYDMMTNIGKHVKVRDYHKVDNYDSATGTLTFCEPIMREINLTRDGTWKIWSYKNYSNVGIENLTFLGHAPSEFWHHGGVNHDHDPWLMDGGFKPLTMTGLVNSWVRNVESQSISECLRFKMCANCSAYDIEITGNRGHAGVSSAGSSRIFIGDVNDHSDGKPVKTQAPYGNRETGAGQYHASGVSKPSMGAVLWRNQWGKDANFESHSGQPRATLIDHCKGGWVEQRFGGDKNEIPNHLGDLCIWNMEAVTYRSPTFVDAGYNSGKFQFWYDGPDKLLWRVTPPIIVGFHGAANVDFDETLSTSGNPGQMKYKESMGQKVAIESLYEAQLQERINREGISPAWLNYLQEHTPTF